MLPVKRCCEMDERRAHALGSPSPSPSLSVIARGGKGRRNLGQAPPTRPNPTRERLWGFPPPSSYRKRMFEAYLVVRGQNNVGREARLQVTCGLYLPLPPPLPLPLPLPPPLPHGSLSPRPLLTMGITASLTKSPTPFTAFSPISPFQACRPSFFHPPHCPHAV